MTTSRAGDPRPLGADPVAVAIPAPRRSRGTRDRVLDAAVELTAEGGWAGVTMGKLAIRAGVARQTVYNEIGTKAQLAEVMLVREVERFLGCVTRAFEAHPDDLLAAVHAASYAVLDQAADNQLLHAILGATHGADTELLPYLSSHSAGLLEVAHAVVSGGVAGYGIQAPQEQVELIVDVVVRHVLSHCVHPGDAPADVADGITWVVAGMLAAYVPPWADGRVSGGVDATADPARDPG